MAEEPLLDEQGILEVGPGRTFFWAISMDEEVEAEERKDPEHV